MRVLLILLLLLPTHTLAQEETFTINLRDADITLLTEQVAEITGRTLVVHPDLAGDITVVSAEPLDAEGAWELYQSIIGLRGFVAVESGAIWQVVPQETARTATQIAEGTPGSQDIVTRLIRLERLPAEEAVRVLRPLVAAIGAIEPLADPNAVVVTDRRENVEKMTEIATRLDADTGEITEVITFDFAEASVVGTAIAEILGPSSAGTRLSVDPTSNSLIARGSPEDIAELLNLARSLDVAPKPNPQVALKTEVFRLNYGDATLIADLVRNTLSRTAAVTNPVAASLATDGAQNLTARRGAPPPVPEVSVQPSTEINAVVARGTDAQLVEVRGLIQRLDQRRAQVMIEAAIVEVSGEAAERLSVQLGFDQFTPQTGLAATSFGNNGTALSSVLTALGVPGASLLAGGGTLTIGRNNTFGLLLQALNQTSSANLLSTPSITTLDNHPASIVVGQNVPFRTGSFATDGNTAEPFTTIERRDVGITMNVLPRVNAGNVVRLDIAQEVSSLVNANLEGAADLITNRRSIETSVLVDNGATIVLGGLITRDDLEALSKVPLLGDIPLVGNLFRSRSENKTRRTLFVFLRPTILTSAQDLQSGYERRLQELSGARPLREVPLELKGLY